MKHKLIIIWGYLKELILVILIFILIRIFCESVELAGFIFKNIASLLSFIGMLFGASITFLVYYTQQQTSDFGKYIYVKGVYKVYYQAFALTIFIHLVSFILLLISNFSKSNNLANAAIISVLYSLINLYTTINNVFGLIQLQNRFRIEKENFKK